MKDRIVDGERRGLVLAWSVAASVTVLFAFGCGKKAERIDLSRYVHMDPGWGIIEIPRQSVVSKVWVRNLSRRALTSLQLEAQSGAVDVSITPKGIKEVIPGQRKAFALRIERKKEAKPQRHGLALTLKAKGLPVDAGLDLVVDLAPPRSGEWVSVGQIKLVRRGGSKSAYYLLIGFPLLLVVGWLLWRISQRRPAKGEKEEGS